MSWVDRGWIEGRPRWQKVAEQSTKERWKQCRKCGVIDGTKAQENLEVMKMSCILTGIVITLFYTRKWQPTPVLLPGKSHGRRILAGYSPWGHRVGHDWVTWLSFLYTWVYAFIKIHLTQGISGKGWLSSKESTWQCRKHGFHPWVRKIPLEKKMATHSNILA